MSEVRRILDEKGVKAPRGSTPSWVDPMLATLTDQRFDDPDWIYERKLDGERCLAVGDGKRVRLFSRNRQDLGSTYPEVVEALRAQDLSRFVLDGEIVAFRGAVTSFARLQGRMHASDAEEARASGIAVYYYLFDAPHLDGFDLSGAPLRVRKTCLRAALSFSDPLRLTPHRNERGRDYYRQACRKGWEGLIAKDASASYVHGRSRKWLKFKCVHQQELVIGGYTDPQGERNDFGALLVGYHQDGELRYAGKVGTGYDEETLHRLGRRLRSRRRKTPPFSPQDDLPSSGVHWVRPDLVGQFGFTEWTDEGRLRHPRFLGLRRDKDPDDVVREEA